MKPMSTALKEISEAHDHAAHALDILEKRQEQRAVAAELRAAVGTLARIKRQWTAERSRWTK